LARDPTRLEGRSWVNQVEIVEGDLLEAETLREAFRGIGVVYYLVHSLGGGDAFPERDVTAARNCAEAARKAGVERIIYLGGLGDPDARLSTHLRSRQETGEALRSTDVQVTELRAAVIVGSGSVSFEMIRYLTERLPVMICPRWVNTKVQPIAIRNVIDYLLAVLDQPATVGKILEIGGTDVLTYAQMMKGYAKARGLKRWLISVPFLTPRLSSYWVHIITPISASIARPLIKGLANEVIVRDNEAQRLMPDIRLLDYKESLERALMRLQNQIVETSWSDALASSQGDVRPVALISREGMILERREHIAAATPAATFRDFSSLGGRRGWLYMNWAWKARGIVDRALGGVGMRRGRRDPHHLRVGDAVDFWRVEAVVPDRLIRLRAEMKVPGRAWLEFEAHPRDDGQTDLTQTAIFEPKGLAGLAYWYLLYPMHALIFVGMIRRIARSASEREQSKDEH
jgi:uncharacterized protein YbjT (DUF2867 family)